MIGNLVDRATHLLFNSTQTMAENQRLIPCSFSSFSQKIILGNPDVIFLMLFAILRYFSGIASERWPRHPGTSGSGKTNRFVHRAWPAPAGRVPEPMTEISRVDTLGNLIRTSASFPSPPSPPSSAKLFILCIHRSPPTSSLPRRTLQTRPDRIW